MLAAHVAIDARVTACDIAHGPLKDGALDIAVFCLALMGANFTDYVREAHRCLRLDGWLHIWEPLSYFADVKQFCSSLNRLGFDVMEPQTEGAFVRIYAVRNARKSSPTLVLPCRVYSIGGRLRGTPAAEWIASSLRGDAPHEAASLARPGTSSCRESKP